MTAFRIGKSLADARLFFCAGAAWIMVAVQELVALHGVYDAIFWLS